jgi:D-tagatose-1,6-bisphosphate aldolase subunit GatZ/KbaZ
MSNHLLQIISEHKKGKSIGIYSVCSSNRFVLEASMRQALIDDKFILIESTSNQVDQYGGYSGMNPQQFVRYVQRTADSVGFPKEKIILGGDHLGPNVWKGEKAKDAMEKACVLIRSYISAGFTKIHLDTSMRCADDPGDPNSMFDPSIAAERASDLCKVAEDAFKNMASNSQPPIYVIGTDVPVPGGSQEELKEVHISEIDDVEKTIEITKLAFLSRGLESAWERVIAIVVQPGVEFGNEVVIEYKREKTQQLSKYIEKYDNIIYEAHSTDYQTKNALRQMVEDHFAILKVGPWFTYIFREAIFALAMIESEWLGMKKSAQPSQVREILDKAMLDNTKYWKKYYGGSELKQAYARKYSYSDRARYYWPLPEVQTALERLIKNLTDNSVPLNLLSQYLPVQYQAVREGQISNKPTDIIRHKIMEVTNIYSYACGYK